MGEKIITEFDNISSSYDRQREQLIPCFQDFYNSSVAIAEVDTERPNILDVGAGTGLFSSFFLCKFPKAKLTLIDISDKMLEVAKQRFRGYANIKYIVADYSEYDFTEKYDIIISALSIHHLTDEQKEEFYKKCYSILKNNGVFINADQILGNTKYLDSIYKKQWKSSVEQSGLSKEEILAGYERIKFDKEATLYQQLTWLREAGFSDVDCVYKYYHFAVMFGRRTS
jgi:tRNA (cmo5U34)-methyltransferase